MPNTISQNLQRLQTARTDIATAISDKGVTVPSGSGFEEFPNLITSISSSQPIVELTCTAIEGGSFESGTYSVTPFAIQQGNIILIRIYYKTKSRLERYQNVVSVTGCNIGGLSSYSLKCCGYCWYGSASSGNSNETEYAFSSLPGYINIEYSNNCIYLKSPTATAARGLQVNHFAYLYWFQ